MSRKLLNLKFIKNFLKKRLLLNNPLQMVHINCVGNYKLEPTFIVYSSTGSGGGKGLVAAILINLASAFANEYIAAEDVHNVERIGVEESIKNKSTIETLEAEIEEITKGSAKGPDVVKPEVPEAKPFNMPTYEDFPKKNRGLFLIKIKSTEDSLIGKNIDFQNQKTGSNPVSPINKYTRYTVYFRKHCDCNSIVFSPIRYRFLWSI